MTMALESPGTFPESPMDQDDVVYPCKGCGEILEEGKAFELAGNRWHINCFRCNTCGTLLDSDANLLLLGDGSLICNNCTYSCSACGNKIEDLAILTGDQAYCASCFRCRNCRRKIENLRYARTSQGIFCMSCHESVMAKRRKNKKAAQRQAATNGLNKSLPELPRENALQGAFTPGSEVDTPPEKHSEPASDTSSHQRPARRRKESSTNNVRRDDSPTSADESRKENLTLRPSTYRSNRAPATSKGSQISGMYDSTSGDDGLFVPLVLDTNPLAGSSPMPAKSREFAAGASVLPLPADVRLPQAKDYFARKPVSTGRDLVQETLQETSRSSSTERKQPPSPHIAYQEKSWQPSDHLGDTTRRKKETANDSSPAPSRSNEANANSPSYPSAPSSQTDFKLQDVPKSKRAGSHRSSQSKSSTTGSPVVDGTFHTPLRDVPRSSSPQHMDNLKMQEDDPGAYQPPQTESAPRPSAERPKRGDSLQNSMKQALTRKDTPSMQDSGSTTPNASTGFVENESTPSVSTQANEPTGPQVNGKSISSPIESPTSRSILDVPNAPPARSLSRPSPTGVPLESFTSPRAAPPPPPTPSGRHGTSESVSTIQTEGSNKLSPMNLPRYSTGAEFSMDEDMARILRGEDTSQPEPGVLRKMSNVVRHGRSFSDRGARTVSGSGKWSAKSPRNGSMDISSPISATSPDAREENILLKGQLRRSQQRIAELENEKNGLQSIVNKSADINHVNSEIREKRSTMAFLDSQREIVVRELEILTDHVKRAKDSNKPVDINTLKSDISKDLGASLQRLKDSFAPQIEELIQKRNDLTNEIADLIQMKDKGFQEYESLSTRNAQLIQHNNELIHQIQDFYKANRQPNGQSFDAGRSLANGLGIQLPNKERSETSSDLRTLAGTEGSLSNLTGDNETESIVSTPQVVNIRKQAKANMWKKGTQGLTKGLRGVRGALVSEKSSSQYQLEAMPYNHMSGDALVQKPNEPMRRNFGNFFSGEKQGSKLQQLKLSHSNNSNPSLLSDVTASVANLFGSDLTARCDLEKRVIPSIVTRCVEEVELRGMDVEGIYRKSGGSGQVNQVRVGFEQSNEHDISDPDLDIHAVTSALKQYFRRLPIPLITFDVYDSLLEATRVEDETKKAQKMKDAINTLPRCHRDSLEFLVFHLGRVMAKADVNLMTPLNLAVVFAPTIMRPQSIEREMSDMQTQRNAVQSMLEHSKIIFSDN